MNFVCCALRFFSLLIIETVVFFLDFARVCTITLSCFSYPLTSSTWTSSIDPSVLTESLSYYFERTHDDLFFIKESRLRLVMIRSVVLSNSENRSKVGQTYKIRKRSPHTPGSRKLIKIWQCHKNHSETELEYTFANNISFAYSEYWVTRTPWSVLSFPVLIFFADLVIPWRNLMSSPLIIWRPRVPTRRIQKSTTRYTWSSWTRVHELQAKLRRCSFLPTYQFLRGSRSPAKSVSMSLPLYDVK